MRFERRDLLGGATAPSALETPARRGISAGRVRRVGMEQRRRKSRRQSDSILRWYRKLTPNSLFLSDVCIVAILLNSFEGKILSTVLERNEDSVLPVYLGL